MDKFGVTKQTHKRRMKKLRDLEDELSRVYSHASWLDAHARPTRDNFYANFFYKTTTKIIMVSAWTTWLLARHEINKYEKKQIIRK